MPIPPTVAHFLAHDRPLPATAAAAAAAVPSFLPPGLLALRMRRNNPRQALERVMSDAIAAGGASVGRKTVVDDGGNRPVGCRCRIQEPEGSCETSLGISRREQVMDGLQVFE